MSHWIIDDFEGEPVGDVCGCSEFDDDHYYGEAPDDAAEEVEE